MANIVKIDKKKSEPLFPPGMNKPPAAPEIEAQVLGAMLVEKESIEKVFALLSPESFYRVEHKIIYEAMIALDEAREAIDSVTVYNELNKRKLLEKAGGSGYLAELTQYIVSAANVENHAKIILEKQILRDLIISSTSIVRSAYDDSDDAFTVLDEAEKKILEIREANIKKSFLDMHTATKLALEYIDALNQKHRIPTAVPTGFYDLDEVLGGLQKTDMVIVAARPSMGKTAFALTIAQNAAIDHNIPVGVFSLEMSTTQLALRMICSVGKINAHSVRTGKLAQDQAYKISYAAEKLQKAPIYFDDSPMQNILEIRAKSRRWVRDKKVGLIIIDYLQLMSGPAKSESREREISTISRSLKSLAKELNIPIVCLSQLNRAVEARKDKRPEPADLRESGSLEQDADVVILLHRPEYYGIKVDEQGNNMEGVAVAIVAKQRNGPTGDVSMAFLKDFARFENLAHAHQLAEYNSSPAQIDDEII